MRLTLRDDDGSAHCIGPELLRTATPKSRWSAD